MDGTYEIGRSIAFIVTKPKKREVFAVDFRDRVVHHLVMLRLEPLFGREIQILWQICRRLLCNK